MAGRPPPRPSASSSGSPGRTDLREDRAFKLGLDAIELTFSSSSRGSASRSRCNEGWSTRSARASSGPCSATWTSKPCGATPTATSVPAVVDYKVKTTPLTQPKADHDFQPAVYLAGRWLERDPAARSRSPRWRSPARGGSEMAASLVSTTRSVGQLRGALVRIAQAARQIVACYERFGPDEPWGFADPAGWKCSERYCEAWQRCPGGAGL